MRRYDGPPPPAADGGGRTRPPAAAASVFNSLPLPAVRLIVGVAMLSMFITGTYDLWYVAAHRIPAWTDIDPTRTRDRTPEHLVRYLCG